MTKNGRVGYTNWLGLCDSELRSANLSVKAGGLKSSFSTEVENQILIYSRSRSGLALGSFLKPILMVGIAVRNLNTHGASFASLAARRRTARAAGGRPLHGLRCCTSGRAAGLELVGTSFGFSRISGLCLCHSLPFCQDLSS